MTPQTAPIRVPPWSKKRYSPNSQLGALGFDLRDRGVDVLDTDIAQPGRLHALLAHVVGQAKHAAGIAAIAADNHPVIMFDGRPLAYRPADDGIIKGLCALRI